jgi:hypothetical protein
MKNLILSLGLLGFASIASAQIAPIAGVVDVDSYNGALVSSATLSSTSTYTLDLSAYDSSKVSAQVVYSTGPTFAGVATFTWQSSNDGSHWATTPNTSGTNITTATTPANTLVDFGFYNFRYLRFNYIGQSTGTVNMQAVMNIKQDGIGRF